MGKGTSRISKEEFNEQIDFYGASVSFGVHNISGSSLSRYFPEVLSLAAEGALNPLFTQKELDAERAKILDALIANEKNVPDIARRVTNVLIYGKNHPRGEYITEETINNITLEVIKNYYKDYFIPEVAYLVIVGDVKFDEVRVLVTEKFSEWEYRPAVADVYEEPENLSQTEINFIDAPNAVQTEISVVNVTDLQMTSPDYFAALLANQILGGGAEGRLFLNLREAHGWTYGAYSGIRGNKYISNFSASSSVKNTFADSSVIEIMNEIKRIRETVPTEKDLELAKAKYLGSFIMNAEKPQTIAGFALQTQTQNLPADFYENYIQNINAVTLEQVQAAARKYILDEGARIVIVGKASEILEGIENIGLPVNFFRLIRESCRKAGKKRNRFRYYSEIRLEKIYCRYRRKRVMGIGQNTYGSRKSQY